MKKSIVSLLYSLLFCCVLISRMAANANPTFALTTVFDATFDFPNSTLTSPFVGSGTLSYSAATPLGDGSYAWSSFNGLQIALTFPSTTFSVGDLVTTSSQVSVEIRGSNFFFSNTGGAGDGAFGGSADFINGTSWGFSAEPYQTNVGPLVGGGINSPRYFVNSPGHTEDIQGTYGVITAIPEPSNVALGMAGVIGCAALWRRKRRATVAAV